MKERTEKKSRMDACSVDYDQSLEMLTNCENCKYYKLCDSFDGCDGCPMHYDSPFSMHHCHCCAYITRNELKQKKCKFYKPNVE